MLTATRQTTGEKVAAWEATKDAGPYLCFCCRQMVALHKGEIKAAHFAHLPPVTCEYGAGESEAHRRCKIALYENLMLDSRVRKCEMERDLGTVRPDVSAYISDVPVAIEVQLSNLTLSKIQYRTAEYARKGIYVLWLPIYTSRLRRELYTPRPWELWLHTLYQGRFYYWLEGLKVVPVNLRDYYIRTKGLTKDYHKLSRKKVVIESAPLTLTDDFGPRKIEPQSARHFATPRATLFMEVE